MKTVLLTLMVAVTGTSSPKTGPSDEFLRINEVRPTVEALFRAAEQNNQSLLLDLIDPDTEVSDFRDGKRLFYTWEQWVDRHHKSGWSLNRPRSIRLIESRNIDHVEAYTCVWKTIRLDPKGAFQSNGIMQIRFEKHASGWVAASVRYVDGGCP